MQNTIATGLTFAEAVTLYRKWAEPHGGVFNQPSDGLSEEVDGVWYLRNVHSPLAKVTSKGVVSRLTESDDDNETPSNVTVSRLLDDEEIHIACYGRYGITVNDWVAAVLKKLLRPIVTGSDVEELTSDEQAASVFVDCLEDGCHIDFNGLATSFFIKLDESDVKQLYEGMAAAGI